MTNTNTTLIQTISQRLVAQLAPELSPEQRAEYEQSVQQLLLARLGAALLEALNPDDRATYQTQFVDKNLTNSTEAQQFVASKIPTIEAVMTKEAEAFMRDFIQKQ